MTPSGSRLALRRSVAGAGLLLTAFAFGAPQTAREHRREYTLGIVPFLPPERLELTFGHLAKRFGETLSRDVHFRTSTTYERYVDKLLTEEYDFAQVPPFVFVQIDPGTYVPLARPPGSVASDFVVLESSHFTKLAELKGETIAAHFSGNDVIEYTIHNALIEAGLHPGKDVKVNSFGTPLSCLQQVLVGTASACATTVYTKETFEEQTGARFRTIGHTVSVPFGPFVAHKRVSPEEREVIRNMLLTWGEDPRNAPPVPVSGARVPSFVPVEPGDYDFVREIAKRVGSH